MTLKEQHQRVAALKFRVRSARKRMTCALATMDYETALECQVEIGGLLHEADHLLRSQHDKLRRAELRPVKPVSFVGVRPI